MKHQEPNFAYRCHVVRVVDGDTLDVDLDLGCHVWIRRRLRLANVNAWETRGAEREQGKAAKKYVEGLVHHADRIVVQTEMDGEGKYGRLLAHVYLINPLGLSYLNALLIREGHGR